MMGVYVDRARPCLKSKSWPYETSAHLIADTKEELEEFGVEKLELKLKWLQFAHGFWHFDVTKTKQLEAIREGAIFLERKEFVNKMREIQGKEPYK